VTPNYTRTREACVRLNNDLGTLEDPEVCYILTLVPTATATGGICTNDVGSDTDPCQGNTPTPNPTVTPTVTPTPTPTNTPINTIQALITEIATYGISTYQNGSGTRSNGQSWTLEELQQVLLAIQHTASAFNRLKYNNHSGTTTQARQLFSAIMRNQSNGNNLEVLRVTNNFVFGNNDPCDGTIGAGCTSNGNNVIAFYNTFAKIS